MALGLQGARRNRFVARQKTTRMINASQTADIGQRSWTVGVDQRSRTTDPGSVWRNERDERWGGTDE
jgi:hypothetical protein